MWCYNTTKWSALFNTVNDAEILYTFFFLSLQRSIARAQLEVDVMPVNVPDDNIKRQLARNRLYDSEYQKTVLCVPTICWEIALKLVQCISFNVGLAIKYTSGKLEGYWQSALKNTWLVNDVVFCKSLRHAQG